MAGVGKGKVEKPGRQVKYELLAEKGVFTKENWVVVSNIFYFHPYLGKWSNLTNIFQMD